MIREIGFIGEIRGIGEIDVLSLDTRNTQGT